MVLLSRVLQLFWEQESSNCIECHESNFLRAHVYIIVTVTQKGLPFLKICLYHLCNRSWCQLVVFYVSSFGESSATQIVLTFFVVENLEHVLVRFFQTKLFCNLVQWQIDFTFKLLYLIKAPVEIKTMCQTDLEEKLNNSTLQEVIVTSQVCRCLNFVSELQKLFISNHNIDENVQVCQFAIF